MADYYCVIEYIDDERTLLENFTVTKIKKNHQGIKRDIVDVGVAKLSSFFQRLAMELC